MTCTNAEYRIFISQDNDEKLIDSCVNRDARFAAAALSLKSAIWYTVGGKDAAEGGCRAGS